MCAECIGLRMNVFVCTDHDLHYPVGCASVVVADGEDQARELLDAELVRRGLRPHAVEPYTLKQLPAGRALAVVLCDGDY